jgi:hypothetical protein
MSPALHVLQGNLHQQMALYLLMEKLNGALTDTSANYTIKLFFLSSFFSSTN